MMFWRYTFVQCEIVFLLAITLDFFIGDPSYSLHPVRITGRAISFFEHVLYISGWRGFFRGLALFVCMLVVTLITIACLYLLIHSLNEIAAILFSVYIVYSCIAYRDLIRHCNAVYSALIENDIVRSRHALSMIVGRDVLCLDSVGIGRALIETLAENFVDGFLAPVFWFVLGCFSGKWLAVEPVLPGTLCIVLYRTVNTLDSMLGYKNARYRYFGFFSARADDLMNWIPARISVFIIAASAGLCGMNPLSCLRIAVRDRLNHSSPNAGHPESCIAGAIGARLGGPVTYSYGTVEKAWMGEGSENVTREHINRSLTVIHCSFWLSSFFAIMLLFLISIPHV